MTMTLVSLPGVLSSSILSWRMSVRFGSSPNGWSMVILICLPSISTVPSVAFLGRPKCLTGMSLVTWSPDATKNGRMRISS